ncbi:alpha/beta hydrolase domain-containing protein [Actinomadura sp. 6K520]|uniref:alpha/beta hydrolase domain-containing protein n=1 Tax=Actinomadura sp. 6K520 TaxID=2530364 RepID=UPI001FB62A2E|nr:alpha/beta hydrolase domain-containing protein [Actinomadura sp. 6K520]
MQFSPFTRLLAASLVAAGLVIAPGTAHARGAPGTVVEGPIPGAPPGDPSSPDVDDTYPWMATNADLASLGYVEQEFFVSGEASAYSPTGERLATGVPYKTRVVVRKPARPHRYNGTVIAEWQNVTAGYDLDALWSTDQITRDGYAWAGISAQRVGVEHLTGWSPARYGDLDVTGGGRFTEDELSYDIYAQVAKTLRTSSPLGGLRTGTVLAAGASQSAFRMTTYYDAVLPQSEKVFDGYAFIVGPAPARRGPEPVFHVLSETDVRSPVRPPDTETYRRWEVAGSAHSGWHGQEYRRPILTRDLGEAPTYRCDAPPFSRVPLHHVIATSYDHLVRWTKGRTPPSAPPLQFNPDGSKARDALGLAKGGIRLSQVEAPTALNTGDNSGETFCFLFGTHAPFDRAQLDALYRSHGRYVAAVVRSDARNLRQGYLLPADARQNRTDALRSGIGRD